MNIDSVTFLAVIEELKNILLNERVQSIYSSALLDVVFLFRKGTLLISARGDQSRLHLTEHPPCVPDTHFVNLLSTHLAKSYLVGIEQQGFDRIVRFTFQSKDQIKGITQKDLVIELMGKHSNIILLNPKDNLIWGSIKSVSFKISRLRQVLAGLPYQPPPAFKVPSLLDITENGFYDFLLKADKKEKVSQVISGNTSGFSPLLIKELFYGAELPLDLEVSQMKEAFYCRLWNKLEKIRQQIEKRNFCPSAYFNEGEKDPFLFSAFPLEQFKHITVKYFESINQGLDYFYSHKEKNTFLKEKKELAKNLDTVLAKTKRKIEQTQQALTNYKEAELLKEKGDLILLNLDSIPPNSSKVKLINPYSDSETAVEITLNPLQTPSENAQIYFKNYRKAKSGYQFVQEQLNNLNQEIAYLEDTKFYFDQIENEEDLQELKDELKEHGYLQAGRVQKKKQKKTPSFIRFLADNYEIYIGKNSTSNDYITTKIAQKTDLWFHARNYPGSHVVLALRKSNPTDKQIQQAAGLAAYYSKARDSQKVEVIYTFARYLRKPSGAKPGYVTYQREKSIFVTPAK